MTGDELGAALFAQQGYVIWATANPKEIGTIETELTDCEDGHETSTPYRYVAKATKSEFMKQHRLIKRLRDVPEDEDGAPWWANYFYRVEAAD